MDFAFFLVGLTAVVSGLFWLQSNIRKTYPHLYSHKSHGKAGH
jgi:hypothetical protein